MGSLHQSPMDTESFLEWRGANSDALLSEPDSKAVLAGKRFVG